MSDSPVKITNVTSGHRKVENKEKSFTTVVVEELWSEIDGEHHGTPLFLDNHIGDAQADVNGKKYKFDLSSGLDGSIHIHLKSEPGRMFSVTTRDVIEAVLKKIEESE